ncbi:hypothetical protein CTI14_48540, partial [Methylobacterium radiotolerans]
VRSGPSSSVNISCDEGATGEGEAKRTSIFIEIAGKAPPPRSTVDVLTDGERLQLDTDARARSSPIARVRGPIRRAVVAGLRQLDRGERPGLRRVHVRSGPSSSVNISCDEGATGEGEAKRTSIFIEIA